MTQAAAGALVVLFLCTAAWWDVTTGRIPNAVTVAGLAAALILRAPLGIEQFLQGLGGLGIAFGLALVFYALRAIGGGDVKLLAGVGAFLGSSEILGALGLIAVLGAVFALLLVSLRGLLPLLVFNTLELIKSWLTLGRAGSVRSPDTSNALTIPYAVPIGVGTLVWWFVEGVRI